MQTFYRINEYNLNAESGYTFHSGHQYRILFIVHGNCEISSYDHAENQKRHCHSPDMILLKPEQTLLVSSQKTSCFILSVSVSVEALAALSDETCDLVQKFQFAPNEISVIHAEIKSCMLIRNILMKLYTLKDEDPALGTRLYEKSLFTTFLILFLRACVQSDQVYQTSQKKILIIDNVFEYISRHLTEDLSLKALEKEFFVSGEHISREFKKSTGITLHTYITRSRIDLSKRYLLQGTPVRDICQLCGFSSYNHFFKAFKKECGMTPLGYYRKFQKVQE